MAIPKIIYDQAHKDIFNACWQGEYDVQEAIRRWQEVLKDFYESYPNQTLDR